MPRLTHRNPAYGKHKASGLAIVTIDGVDRYLGKHGTAESNATYRRLIAEWKASGGTQPGGLPVIDLTIVELIASYLRFAESYFVKDGRQTSEVHCLRSAVRPLKELYGRLPVRDFGPLKLKTVRDEMIKRGWARNTVNNQISRIKKMFRWAGENELIPPTKYQELQAVAGLRRGRSIAPETEPVKPVAEDHVHRVASHVSPPVAAMLRLQLLTGMRSGELTAMRPLDITLSDDIWEYRPQSHKTEHHGVERVIPLGPQAQAIIRPLLNREICACLFSPAEAEDHRRAECSARRRTPLQYRNRPGTNRKRRVRRAPGDRYTTQSYHRAVTRGCDAAFPPPEGLTGEQLKAWRKENRFHPHQLRHTAATRIRRQYGLEAAQCILGHTNIETTQIYAEVNRGQAARIMGEVG